MFTWSCGALILTSAKASGRGSGGMPMVCLSAQSTNLAILSTRRIDGIKATATPAPPKYISMEGLVVSIRWHLGYVGR